MLRLVTRRRGRGLQAAAPICIATRSAAGCARAAVRRLAALTSGGAIPETAVYRVVAEPERTFVGTVDEDFAIESLAGDVFLLGNTSWRIRIRARRRSVVVATPKARPRACPFWLGEAPGRTRELSAAVSQLRVDLADCGRRRTEQPAARLG